MRKNGGYKVYGRTRVKDCISPFSGTMQIDSVRYFEVDSQLCDFITECGEVVLSYAFAVGEQCGQGRLEGTARYGYYIRNGACFYDAIHFSADGYCNGQFEGICRHASGQVEKCCWGNCRIPGGGDLDIGVAEFWPAPAYMQNGWEVYMLQYGYKEPFTMEDIDKCQLDKDWWK